MSDYLKNPVPFLSVNNVEFICKKMEQQHSCFIEYGLGASTLYFSDKFTGYKMKIVSVENTIDWFNSIVKVFRENKDWKELSHTTRPLSLSEIRQFIKALSSENSSAPPELSRLKKWKDSLQLGPFYRFSPYSSSRFSGTIPLWSVSKWFLIFLNFLIYFFFPAGRPTRGEFVTKKGMLEVICRNVPPSVKDQHGESPSAEEYIEAGLRDLRDELKENDKRVRAAFFIDGGPRAKILRTVLEMEDEFPNFYPTVFLCEAHRAYYNDTMALRPSGIFLPGSNLTIKGQVVQPDPGKHDRETMNYCFGKDSVTKEELAQKEMWFYQKEGTDQTSANAV